MRLVVYMLLHTLQVEAAAVLTSTASPAIVFIIYILVLKSALAVRLCQVSYRRIYMMGRRGQPKARRPTGFCVNTRHASSFRLRDF